MQIQIKNQHLTCDFDEKGAELISLKNNENINFLWNGDEKFWSGRSPILFPIVGILKNNSYKIDEKIFNMQRHGFARNLIFTLIEKHDNCCTFFLKYNEETLKQYPFKFELKIHYKLNDNTLEIYYEVKNIDEKEMFFSIGSHPAFNCPFFNGEDFKDYYVEFSSNETLDKYLISHEGLIKRNPIPFLNHENKIPSIKNVALEEATLIVKNPKSEFLSLKNTKNPYEIKIKIKDHSYLGIWSDSKESPFICIEPWQGIGDFEDTSGDVLKKDGIIKLDPKEKYVTEYSITINKFM